MRIHLAIVLGALVLYGTKPALADPLEDARRDFLEHKPIPGLPDLSRPVFIEKDALVCGTPTMFASGMYAAALDGSQQAVAVLHQNCAVVRSRVRVKLLVPQDGNQYVLAHMHRYVEFVAPPAQESNGSIVTGWVLIADLVGEPSASARPSPRVSSKPPPAGHVKVSHDVDIKFRLCLLNEAKRGPYSSHDGGNSAFLIMVSGCPNEFTAWYKNCTASGNTQDACNKRSASIAAMSIDFAGK